MKKITLLIFGIFLIFSSAAWSQVTEEMAKTNFKAGKYHEALKQYLELYRQDTANITFNHQIARCYLRMFVDRSQAIPYMEFVTKQKDATAEAFFDLALAHSHAHHFEMAILYLNECLRKAKNNDLKDKAERQIEVCLNAQALMKTELNVKFINLGRKINSSGMDCNPFVTADETMLLFSSDRDGSYDVFLAKQKKGSENWGKAKSLSAEVNTNDDEFVSGMSKDGDALMVHYNEFSAVEDINISLGKKGRYSELSDLGKSVNTTAKEEGACFSPSGDTLFFTSSRPKGKGGLDLYFSVRLPTGDWSIPTNLGETINTPFDENYPNLSPDGLTLYFASKGHNSMGGYDIFIAKRDSIGGNWKTPVSFGFPINDTYDNTIISMVRNQRYGYIAALKPSGFGDLDIYKIVFNNIEPDLLILKGIIAIGDTASSIPLKNVSTDIKITVYNEKNEVYGTYTFNKSTGAYVISLAPGKYELVIEGENYVSYKKLIEVNEEVLESRNRNLNIFLQKKK